MAARGMLAVVLAASSFLALSVNPNPVSAAYCTGNDVGMLRGMQVHYQAYNTLDGTSFSGAYKVYGFSCWNRTTHMTYAPNGNADTWYEYVSGVPATSASKGIYYSGTSTVHWVNFGVNVLCGVFPFNYVVTTYWYPRLSEDGYGNWTYDQGSTQSACNYWLLSYMDRQNL